MPFLAAASVLPQQFMWMANGRFVLMAAILLAVLGLCVRLRKPGLAPVIGISLAALGVADLCYSLLPLCEGYRFFSNLKESMKEVALMLQVGSIVLFFWAPSKS